MAAAVFWSLLISSVGMGWWAGDTSDRRLIACIVLATVATLVVNLLFGMAGGGFVTAVDIVLFALVFAYAMFSQKFWPIWFAAFLLIGVVSDVSGLLFSSNNTWAFRMVSAFWAIPCLIIMPLGILLDNRAGRRLS